MCVVGELRLKVLSSKHQLSGMRTGHDWLFLGFWIAIASGLRLSQLTAKPPWTDEFATMVFSLGNNFRSLPLDRVISLETLLQLLQPNPHAGIGDIARLLLHEDNHPPLYFVLSHLWLKLFPSAGGYLSLWAARSLPALFGILSIPAIYYLGRFAFRSRLAGHLSAAMMAVSPYAIFLAQEARHYTLAILGVIASLACAIAAARYLCSQAPLPFWLVFLWIAINGIGLSVHYFLSLTFGAEAIAFLCLAGSQRQHAQLILKPWWRLGIVVLGTMTTGGMWLLVALPGDYGKGMTEWIRFSAIDFIAIISPLFQLLAAWITMLALLPVESPSLAIVIASGLLMLFFFIWAVPILIGGLKVSWQQPASQLATRFFISFVGSAIALFFLITYGVGFDITRGARYSFVYFPAVILLLGASLAACWRSQAFNLKLPTAIRNLLGNSRDGHLAVTLIGLMGLLGAITVCANLGYQKYYRPEQLAPLISQRASTPILLATTHKSLVQTGEMMGLAWELRQNPERANISVLLAHQERDGSRQATQALQQSVANLPRPLDVWTINFYAPIELPACTADSQVFPPINGYAYQRYHCPIP
jgi:uncharacterized membrane protein